MANVSYYRTSAGPRSRTRPMGNFGDAPRRRRRAPWFIGGGLLAVLCALAAAVLVVASSKASIGAAPGQLAKVNLPMGGGTVDDVVATTGPQQKEKLVKVGLRGDPVVVPEQKIPAGEKIVVTAKVRRPGWISWLTGKTETLTRTVTVPTSQVRDHFVTLSRSGALQLHFSKPVRTVSYGPSAGRLTRHALAHPQSVVTVPHSGSAGTMFVSATVQHWETSDSSSISWFPAGTKATAIAQPAAGNTISSDTPITLTFSKATAKVLGSHLPTVSPAGAGSWKRISSHVIRFVPSGYGYGLAQAVKIGLPAGVRLTGAQQDGSATSGVWKVPAGTTTRLQQLLAQLGYLPLSVHYAAGATPANTTSAQLAAATDAPKATLDWTYGNTPAGLKSQYQGPAAFTELTKGAVMAFEGQHDMTPDGIPGPAVWKALIKAEVAGQRNTFGYTFVSASENTPESLFLWHNGQMVMSNVPVNTGVPGATTQTGTFAVFEHTPVTQMIGTNVNGSHYDDTVHWVSYFNGGDALHYFNRPGYGYPQSNGCVEMDLPNAEHVYQYTPVGTIVQVNS